MVDKDNLYTYLDNTNNLAIHLFQGEELVRELLTTHGVSELAKPLIKDLILSLQSLVVFLKEEESLGVYIDCSSPDLHFKLESSAMGSTRILILPENYNEAGKELTGTCQLTKFSPPDNIPYTSLINFENKTSAEILNQIFTQSYQMESHFIFQNEYNFILVHQLPGSEMSLNIKEYIQTTDFALDDSTKFQFLDSKKIKFRCNCNKERFISRINSLSNKDELLNECPLEIKCDYCKKEYLVEAKDLTA